MELPDLPIQATCVRVPVMVGHAEAVWIEIEDDLLAERARELLGAAPSVRVEEFPSPGKAAGIDDVLVGRIRRDPTVEHGLALFLASDNLRKGAALNAIQIAELVLDRARAAAQPVARQPSDAGAPTPRAGPTFSRAAKLACTPRHSNVVSRAAARSPRSGLRRRRRSRTRPSRRAAPSRACPRRPAAGRRARGATSPTRPAARTTWKPKSARKSCGNTVLWTRKALVARLALRVAVRERLERTRAAVARLADRREEERLQHPRARRVDEVRARDEDRVVGRRAAGQLVRAREGLRRAVLHRAEHAAVGVVVDGAERAELELDLLHPAVLVDRAAAARLPPDALVADARRRLERQLRQPGERVTARLPTAGRRRRRRAPTSASTSAIRAR